MAGTLKIDEQLLAAAEGAARAKGLSVRKFVEETLRAAIPMTSTGLFSQRAHDFGAHLESPWTALAEIEGEAYTTTGRK